MKRPTFSRLCMMGAFLSLTAFIGCQTASTNRTTSSQGGDSGMMSSDSGMDSAGMTGSGSVALGSTSMAFPTGNQSTSVLLVEPSGPSEVRVGEQYQYRIKVTNLTDTTLHGVRVINQDTSGFARTTGGMSADMSSQQPPPDRSGDRDMGEGGDDEVWPHTDIDINELERGRKPNNLNESLERPSAPDRSMNRQGSMRQQRSMSGGGAIENEIPGSTVISGTQTWNIGTLGPRESKTINVDATAGTTGTVVFCLTAEYSSFVCLATNVTQPALELTKSGPTGPVLRCDPITYTVTVRNTGTGAARNVRVEDNLPSGMQTEDGRNSLTFDAGTLQAGQSRQFTVNARATQSGEFTNESSVSADGGLSDSASVSTTVREPELEITKSGRENDFIGAEIPYEITVSNVGDGEARDTVLRENIPSGMEFVNASQGGQLQGNQVRWNLGTLQPNDERTVNVTLRGTGIGTKTNTATASAYCAEDVTASSTLELTGISALLLEVIDNPDPVRVGTTTQYRITVTNQGSNTARRIDIVADLEDAVEFVSANGPTQHSVQGDTINFAPLPQLDPGSEASWTVTVRGAIGEETNSVDSRFFVEMTSDLLERPVRETEATHIYR